MNFPPTFVYNGRKERRCGWDEEMGGASARVSAFARRDGERGGAARRPGGGLFHRQFGWNGFDAEPDACAEKGGLCVFLGELVRHEPRGAAVIQAMYDQYGEDCGFTVAGVEAEDTVSTVEALKQTLGLTTLPMGTGGLYAFLAYEQPGIPFSVLIDADGTVRAMHLGVATAEGRLDALDDIR